MPDPIKVFVSYRRADTQHVAGRFADKVDSRFQVFMDIDTIPPGVDFTEYVRKAVSHCDVLLAFIGEKWVDATDAAGQRRLDDAGDWVAEEIRTALQRDVRVIPVLVDGAVLPDPERLPESLRPLTTRQTLPLRHASFSADAARLIAAVQAAAARTDDDGYGPRWEADPAPPPVQVVLAPARRSSPWKRPVLWIGLAVMIMIVLVSVALIVRHGMDRTASGSTADAVPDSGSAGTSGSSAAGRPVEPVNSVEELRARVPVELRTDCRELAPEAAALQESLRAAVQCTPPDAARVPHYLFYFAYGDVAAAHRAFRRYYGTTSLPAGNCAQSAAEAPYQRQGGRSVGGTLLCYVDADGLRVFAWTNDEFAVVASAADRDLEFSQLRSWWEDAGPVVEGR